jgi:hypothetical protein
VRMAEVKGARQSDRRVLGEPLRLDGEALRIERLLVPAGQVENVTGVVEKGGKKVNGR